MPEPDVLLSVVVPAHDEAGSLPALLQDLRELGTRIGGRLEVVVVDDGSRDDTWAVLQRESAADPRVVPVRLSRNYGHQVALSAGLASARGRAVVTMDADRQHPVPVVLEMLDRWREGHDVAYGVMVARPSESAFKRSSSDLFYRLLNHVSDTEMPSNAGDFRLMDRRVVDAFLAMPERSRYIRGMVSWLGFDSVAVPYTCAPRHAGSSTYTLRRMLALAADALLSFSTWPLRAGLALGSAVSVLAVLMGLVTIAMRLFSHTVPGWATIVVVVSFLGGAQLVVLGVIGQYVGRIHDELKGRPLYVTQDGDRSSRARQRAGVPLPRTASDARLLAVR